MNKLRSPQHYCRMYVGCVPVCVHCVSRGLRGVHMYACAVSPPLVCSGIRHIYYIYIYICVPEYHIDDHFEQHEESALCRFVFVVCYV